MFRRKRAILHTYRYRHTLTTMMTFGLWCYVLFYNSNIISTVWNVLKNLLFKFDTSYINFARLLNCRTFNAFRAQGAHVLKWNSLKKTMIRWKKALSELGVNYIILQVVAYTYTVSTVRNLMVFGILANNEMLYKRFILKLVFAAVSFHFAVRCAAICKKARRCSRVVLR